MLQKTQPPVLFYLVTEDWYFLSHRLPMAMAARDAGYSVHVATNVNKHGAEIEALGFRLHRLSWQRGSLNPRRLLSIIREIRYLYRKYSPDIVHHVALQPTIIGSVAAWRMPFIRVNALAGLGYGFSSRSLKARILRPALTFLLRILLRGPRAVVLVQNPDDRMVVLHLGVVADRVSVIPGSGVDVHKFQPQPEPAGAVTVAFVGRLLVDKGIRTLIAAHKLLRESGEIIELIIAGDRDPGNPASVSTAEIEDWKDNDAIQVLGNVSEIEKVWACSHIAVLPSWREGLPKSLLEAAACGRPIIATDVPGCREIARQNINALLVPVENPRALAAAIRRLAHDSELRRQLGAAGRQLAEREFSNARIGQEIVALYDRLVRRQGVLLPAPTQQA
jgi:glycosyltransferase involved in cell wall biosynthesis